MDFREANICGTIGRNKNAGVFERHKTAGTVGQASNGGVVRTGDGYYIVHLFAIQNELLDPIVEHLNHDISFVGAWLCVCQDLPGVQGLADLKRLHPTALPSWLALEKTADILVRLVLVLSS